MRSWSRRLAVIVVALLAIVAIVGGTSYRLLRGTPQWYRRSTATLAQKEESARSAFNKFAGIVNAAAAIRSARQHPSSTSPADALIRAPSQIIEVSFTDDELNAFFEKWASFKDWKKTYEPYIDEPIINLRAGSMILAAKVKDLDTVVSIEFEPMLIPPLDHGVDSEEQLNLRISRILGGRLPLPDAFARPYLHRITDALRSHLPAWRANATILPDGGANESLICASLARLLIHTLEHEPADPILFLPVVEKQANVPVRIVAVNIKDHVLTMSVTPLDSDGRRKLLQRIQASDPTIDNTPAPPATVVMSR